jgi:hypothetical protein
METIFDDLSQALQQPHRDVLALISRCRREALQVLLSAWE